MGEGGNLGYLAYLIIVADDLIKDFPAKFAYLIIAHPCHNVCGEFLWAVGDRYRVDGIFTVEDHIQFRNTRRLIRQSLWIVVVK